MAGGTRREGAHAVGMRSGRPRPRLYLPWPLVPVAVLVYVVILVIAAPLWLIERLFGPGRPHLGGRRCEADRGRPTRV